MEKVIKDTFDQFLSFYIIFTNRTVLYFLADFSIYAWTFENLWNIKQNSKGNFFDIWHLTFWTYLDIFIFQKYFDMICKIMELLEFSDQELTVSFGSFVTNHQLLVNKMIIVHHLCNFGYLSTFFFNFGLRDICGLFFVDSHPNPLLALESAFNISSLSKYSCI